MTERLLPFAFFLLAVAGMAIGLSASEPIEVPRWILDGIMRIESRSYRLRDDSICYVDRRVGRAGEVGAFQLRPIALRDVHLVGMRDEIRRDPSAAEFAATLYLRLCFRRTGSWWRAVGLYHSSDPDEAREYARRVWSLRTF